MTTLEKLSKCRKAFEVWRNGRKGKQKIPDDLWTMAVTLLDDYPISQVATELRLNQTQLRQKQLAFKQQEPQKNRAQEQIPFLELKQFLASANDSSGPRASTLQLLIEKVDGNRLTISLGSSQTHMVQALLTSFIRS